MKSYSLDLRKKIVEAYEKRDRSQREESWREVLE